MKALRRRMESRSGSWASLQFTEVMRGYVGFGETDHSTGAAKGSRAGTDLTLRLTIVVDGVDRFLADPRHQASARGRLRCDALGGELPVEHAICNLLVASDDPQVRRVHYRVRFRDVVGHPLTLTALRDQQRTHSGPMHALPSTTSTVVRILRGHIAEADELTAEVVASGILQTGALDMARQLASVRTSGPARGERLRGLRAFARFVTGDSDAAEPT